MDVAVAALSRSFFFALDSISFSHLQLSTSSLLETKKVTQYKKVENIELH